MSTNNLALLDQAELLQLALNASTAGDSANTIAYLKEAVSRADADAKAHYLLGAEYAQITMYERAIGEMEAAIALDPTLSVARLQLGMLWLGANDTERAANVLQALSELGASDPLRLFGAGLQQLIANRLVDALDSLREGIALNTVNAALNGDMQNIMRHIELRIASGAGPAAAAREEPDSQHILLSAYTSGPRH